MADRSNSGRAPGAVAAIIVSYNTRELTGRCLTALGELETTTTLQVVVMDNASTDGTVDHLRTLHPWAHVIDSPVNLGFAAGVDAAVEQTDAELLLLVNPDAQIHPRALEALLEVTEQRPRSLLGGRILRSDGSIDHTTARRLPSLWTLACSATGVGWLLRRIGMDPDVPRSALGERIARVPMLSGALLLIPRETWEELGGFDRTYFLYAEDVDLCLRAARAGIGCHLVPGATAVHDSGGSSSSTGKKILLLAGECTYLRQNWHGNRRRLGIGLVRLGVLLRALLSRGGGINWRYVWSQRPVWSSGYGPPGEDRSRFIASASRR